MSQIVLQRRRKEQEEEDRDVLTGERNICEEGEKGEQWEGVINERGRRRKKKKKTFLSVRLLWRNRRRKTLRKRNKTYLNKENMFKKTEIPS